MTESNHPASSPLAEAEAPTPTLRSWPRASFHSFYSFLVNEGTYANER